MAETEMIDVLLDFMQSAQESEQDGMTMLQLVKKLGLTAYSTRRLVNQAMAQGLIAPVMVRKKDAWGHYATVRGYKMVQGETV